MKSIDFIGTQKKMTGGYNLNGFKDVIMNLVSDRGPRTDAIKECCRVNQEYWFGCWGLHYV